MCMYTVNPVTVYADTKQNRGALKLYTFTNFTVLKSPGKVHVRSSSCTSGLM